MAQAEANAETRRRLHALLRRDDMAASHPESDGHGGTPSGLLDLRRVVAAMAQAVSAAADVGDADRKDRGRDAVSVAELGTSDAGGDFRARIAQLQVEWDPFQTLLGSTVDEQSDLMAGIDERRALCS